MDKKKLANDALLQIELNHYETEMISLGVRNIFRYGVAFRKKNVEIILIKPDDGR